MKRGDHIFSESDVLDSVYVIRRGKVALGRRVRGRDITLLLLREGDILGDVPMLLQAPASFDAVAESDAELVVIPAGRLLATLDHSPEFARRWLLWLSGRLASAHTRLLSLLAGDVRAQVAALLDQESCHGDAVRLTHQEIASMVGAQRSSVTRALDDLADEGVIATGYGHVTILDHDALVAVARSTGDDQVAVIS
ncbi:MAG: Crp/Fnr family transcriptional regulator [Microbacteriaceae bacterium]